MLLGLLVACSSPGPAARVGSPASSGASPSVAAGARLAVRRAPGIEVRGVDAGRVARTLARARAAKVVVRRETPWGLDLLRVEVPADAAAFRDATGLDPDPASALAAATVGSGRSAHVVVEPEAFASLGPVAQQVVLTHEAVHVALRRARPEARPPAWLSEGYADQVALAGADTPVRVLAGEALRRVRRAGVPPGLPLASEFGGGGLRAGAAYESAWLAVRLIAREYGEARLRAFVAAVADGTGTDLAFRTVLGTTETEVVRAWRHELRRLAG